jgi:hypothetical protein
MKHILKNHANLLTMSIMVAAMALAFLACEEKGKKAEAGGSVKLLERNEYENGIGPAETYEYDRQNRLVKISEYNDNGLSSTRTITYGDDSVTVSVVEYFADGSSEPHYYQNYTINGDTIISFESLFDSKDVITLNKEGYISNINGNGTVITYEYQGGNRTSYTYDGGRGSLDILKFTYDDNKSPFHNDKTPKWLLQHSFFGIDTWFNNNVTSIEGNGMGYIGTYKYQYEFDSDGFPIKKTVIFDDVARVTTLYIYRNGTKGANQ